MLFIYFYLLINFIYLIYKYYFYIYYFYKYKTFRKDFNIFIYIKYILFFFIENKLILILFFIKYFIFELFYVSSNSMSPTLNDGDIILVNKFFYNFKLPFSKVKIVNNPLKNDIIVFKYPFNKNINLVKRILYIPGDKINSKLYLNNKYEDFNFIKNSSIKKDYYFVIGDNTNNSYDSRHWGLLNKYYIIGKVIFRIININFKKNYKIKFIFNLIK